MSTPRLIMPDDSDDQASATARSVSTMTTSSAKLSVGGGLAPKPSVEPTIIQVVDKPRRFVNHTYRDWSKVTTTTTGTSIPMDIGDMTFLEKVHHILAQPEHQQWISWLPHGRAFRVHVPKKFEMEIAENYFGNKRYSTFLRQLSNHGFKQLSQGPDRSCHYHECFLRNMVHLCQYFDPPKDARNLIPDPENELDFYKISATYPLPDERRSASKRIRSNSSEETNVALTNAFSQSPTRSELDKSLSSLDEPLAKRRAVVNDKAVASPVLSSMIATSLRSALMENQLRRAETLRLLLLNNQQNDPLQQLRALVASQVLAQQQQQQQQQSVQSAIDVEKAVSALLLMNPDLPRMMSG